MSHSDLFDIIIDQLLSGVRRDGVRISFRGTTGNDKIYSTSEMRQNFIEVVNDNKDAIFSNKLETHEKHADYIVDIIGAIPILSECVRPNDVEYFENQIFEYIREYRYGRL